MPYASPTVAMRTGTPFAAQSSFAFCSAGLFWKSICSSSTQDAPTPGELSSNFRLQRPFAPSCTATAVSPFSPRA